MQIFYEASNTFMPELFWNRRNTEELAPLLLLCMMGFLFGNLYMDPNPELEPHFIYKLMIFPCLQS